MVVMTKAMRNKGPQVSRRPAADSNMSVRLMFFRTSVDFWAKMVHSASASIQSCFDAIGRTENCPSSPQGCMCGVHSCATIITAQVLIVDGHSAHSEVVQAQFLEDRDTALANIAAGGFE